jgi:Rrf2 family protein
MFTKKVIYGLRLLLALDRLNREHFVNVGEIAEKEQLPLKFLEAIAVALRKAQIVDVKRGARGGYQLTRELEHITLLEVWKALVDKDQLDDECVNRQQKAVHRFLNEGSEKLQSSMAAITLDTMRKFADEEKDNLMYYI